MFVTLHSDIKSLKSGLFHLTDQPIFQKGKAKVEDGIISGTISVNLFSKSSFNLQ